MSVIGLIRRYFDKRKYRNKWMSANSQNETVPGNIFNTDLVSVGRNTYGCINALTFNNENKLIIGSFCSIAPDVMFMLSADHYTGHVSTYPFKAKIVDHGLEGVSKGDIIVDDDAWIGYRATILSGVHIGQGAVVASGAVVTKDVPPYAIVGGVPAKVIRYRFEPELIDFMNTLDYSALDETIVKDHIEELYTPVDEMSAIEVQRLLHWFPKK